MFRRAQTSLVLIAIGRSCLCHQSLRRNGSESCDEDDDEVGVGVVEELVDKPEVGIVPVNLYRLSKMSSEGIFDIDSRISSILYRIRECHHHEE